jgi:hypothetical protein
MVCSDFMASRAYAVFWTGVRKAPFNSTMIGIVRCKTWDSFAVAPNFRRLTPHPDQCPVAIAPAFDDQALCPNRRAVGFLFLQEILFGRKIDRLKKPKTGRCDMQSRIQIDQALPQPRLTRWSRPRQQ